jgi:hypothetical protein
MWMRAYIVVSSLALVVLSTAAFRQASRDYGRSASVTWADAKGQARLKLTVDADGNSRIEFLDAKGQVIQRLPEKQ